MHLNVIQLAESFGVEESVVEGWVRNEAITRQLLPAVPCPRCGGSGWGNCCEGNDASCEVIVADPSPMIGLQAPSRKLQALSDRYQELELGVA